MGVIHFGTNDLKTEKDHVKIADSILRLAHQYKRDTNNVMISGTMPQNNNLNDFVIKVNKILRKACSKRNIAFIDNKDRIRIYDCKQYKLH